MNFCPCSKGHHRLYIFNMGQKKCGTKILLMKTGGVKSRFLLYSITQPNIATTCIQTCTSTPRRSVPSFLVTKAFTNDLGMERVRDSKWWTGGSLGSFPTGPAEVGVCVSTRPITSQERNTLSSSRSRETDERMSLDRG